MSERERRKRRWRPHVREEGVVQERQEKRGRGSVVEEER